MGSSAQLTEFTVNETEWFFENDGAANALLSFASSINDDVNLLYAHNYDNSELQNNITSLKNIRTSCRYTVKYFRTTSRR